MTIYKISLSDTKKFYKSLGCDDAGVVILSKKSKLHTLFIKDLHVGAANILKQDALSIGADLAVPHGVVIATNKYVEAVLIGTTKHFEILSKKELSQPFGLKNLAKELKNYIKEINYKTKIMGVLNANQDSFFERSRFSEIETSSKIENMINEGADIIDIGSVSSRPGSLPVSEEEEFIRIKNIIKFIYINKFYEKIDFSIDSYSPKVIQYSLDNGFKIVNDITGLDNDKVCKIISNYDAKVIIMHMQNNQTTMQNNPIYSNVILDIDYFFEERIKKAKEFGINDLLLDVGIGFGKNLEHNLLLLKNLEHFKHFGYELLIGASRKSLIDNIVSSKTEDRLPGTIALHLEAIRYGASIIRCHDVKEHYQAIKVFEKLENIN